MIRNLIKNTSKPHRTPNSTGPPSPRPLPSAARNPRRSRRQLPYRAAPREILVRRHVFSEYNSDRAQATLPDSHLVLKDFGVRDWDFGNLELLGTKISEDKGELRQVVWVANFITHDRSRKPCVIRRRGCLATPWTYILMVRAIHFYKTLRDARTNELIVNWVARMICFDMSLLL